MHVYSDRIFDILTYLLCFINGKLYTLQSPYIHIFLSFFLSFFNFGFNRADGNFVCYSFSCEWQCPPFMWADLRNSTANSILYLLLLALIHAFISAKALTKKQRKYIFQKIICVIKLTIILMHHHWYFRFYYLLPDFQLIFQSCMWFISFYLLLLSIFFFSFSLSLCLVILNMCSVSVYGYDAKLWNDAQINCYQ